MDAVTDSIIEAPKLVGTFLSRKPEPAALEWSLGVFAVMVAMFAAGEWTAFDPGPFLVASGADVFGRHEFWRAFTSTFVHADFGHLVSNGVFFVAFAHLLRGHFGFWVFPVLSLFAGGATNLIVLAGYPPEASLVGASGIVYFMAAFWFVLYVAIERREPLSRRLLKATGIALILFFPQTFQARVSYAAHAVGFGLGAASGWVYFLARRSAFRAAETWRWPAPPAVIELSPADWAAVAPFGDEDPGPCACASGG